MIRGLVDESCPAAAADPRLLLYIGCALFTVAAPRMKDYSYILMLLPALYVLRDLRRRRLPADYVLLGVGLMIVGQPQQTNVPGMTALVYMLQAYLPLLLSGGALAYLVTALQRAPPPRSAGPDIDEGAAPAASPDPAPTFRAPPRRPRPAAK